MTYLVPLVFGSILIAYDLKSCTVPVAFLILFIGSLLIYCVDNLYWISGLIGCLLILGFMGAELFTGRQLLGIADKILLPVILLTIPPNTLGEYLVFAGGSGLVLAFIWQQFWGQRQFPFVPALLLPMPIFIY